MVCVASRPALALKIPFVMRDFNVGDVCGIKRDVAAAANLADERSANYGYIANDAAIAKSNVHDLVVHAGLRLS